ncbi:MAG: hypothetical protein KI785_13915, partial [Devosiaceae bacterium]|nr:hypothetical protein [Devosiaceae bacterium MH13]
GIMNKLERPTGLINFASLSQTHDEAHLAAPLQEVGGKKRKSTKVRFYGYGVLLLLVGIAMVFTVLNRTGFDVAITPERDPAFVMLSDGSIRNIYNVRLSDRGEETETVRFAITGLEGATVSVSHAGSVLAEGAEPTIDFSQFTAAALRVLITVPTDQSPTGRAPITITLMNGDTGATMTQSSTYFWGPEE